MATDLVNHPAPNLPYFTPFQKVPSGTAVDPDNAPTLFKPIKIRGIEFQNRIWLSPMCQYSADDGHLTDWHIAHLGGIISRGPSLCMVEATAVLPEGRITPQDTGLWKDSQIAPLKRIVEFAHSQNQKMCIQLAHSGRKGSTNAPWIVGPTLAPVELGGWPEDVVGPSPIAYDEGHAVPKELTKDGVQKVKQAFVDAAKRAVEAGFDAIEIHNAHGYLLNNFLSPTSNQRTDEYGGSWDNRVRLTLEIVDAVKAAIPDSTLLFLRISATEWLEHLPDVESWKSEDTIRLAKILATRGVDLLDISSAANDRRQQIAFGIAFQARFSEDVKKALKGTDLEGKMLISVVGAIPRGQVAQNILDGEKADIIMVGRWFQKNPGLVWKWAEDLGVNIHQAKQIGWAFTMLPPGFEGMQENV